MSAQLLIGLFVFVLAAVSAVGYVFVLRPSRNDAGTVLIPTPIALDQHELQGTHGAIADVFRLIGEAIPGGREKANEARQKLMIAGYRWPSAVSVFLGIKYASAVTLAAAGVWATVTFRPDADLVQLVLPAICGIGFGFLLPDRVLARLAVNRVDRMRRGLPAALDLMVLAIEAGQGLDAAILDTARGLRATHPDLAAEFTQLQLELRANTTRAEALRNLGERSKDMELRKFANLLIDTDRFGTSLGPALKTHARYLRIRFRQMAQEKARKVGVKLIFPVFFLIFPSVILVTLGPAVILIFTQMQHLLE
ncbi:MAG TPA: type II secretion system F family protein [Bryobacteraceae bacterium]|jgi:tight adherence protein C|nr:type II secretion system F family protein [Bryobacteraceae bacterium]